MLDPLELHVDFAGRALVERGPGRARPRNGAQVQVDSREYIGRDDGREYVYPVPGLRGSEEMLVGTRVLEWQCRCGRHIQCNKVKLVTRFVAAVRAGLADLIV